MTALVANPSAGISGKLLLFVYLRSIEYLSAALFFMLSVFVFSDDRSYFFENIGKEAYNALRIPLVYFAGFYYWIFSLLVFLVATSLFSVRWKSLSALNALPFVLHSWIFIWSLGRNPFAPDLWVTWSMIVLLNLAVPYLLFRLGWVRFSS